MPDLGTYAVAVLSSYAVTIAMLVGLVWMSWVRFARLRAKLDAMEGARNRDG